MKQNIILIIGLVLCSVAFADYASNLAKMESYVKAQGYTWQQVKSATPKQWRNHAVSAGFDPNEIKQFGRMKNTIRRVIVQKKKRASVVNKTKALLVHIRKAGPDIETMPILRELLENWEVYGVDPNSFN